MGVGVQRYAPAALPPGKTWYPLYRRRRGPQDRSGQVRKISPPRGFDPRTVQSVVSRYTDCAIPTPQCQAHELLRHKVGTPAGPCCIETFIQPWITFTSSSLCCCVETGTMFQNVATEDSGLLVCHTVSLGEQFHTFRRVLVPSVV